MNHESWEDLMEQDARDEARAERQHARRVRNGEYDIDEVPEGEDDEA